MRSFVLSASVLSLLVSFVSVSAMESEDNTSAMHAKAATVKRKVSEQEEKAALSDGLKRNMNGLYFAGRRSGMSGMSCINTVIEAIAKRTEIPLDIRKAHIINWLTEAVEDEKDLKSAYRLYTLTGRQDPFKVWILAQEQQVDLLALARSSKNSILRGDIAVILHTYGQTVPNDLQQDLRAGLRFSLSLESCHKAARHLR